MIRMMGQQKLYVSVPARLAKFLEEYQLQHKLENRSAVVVRALEVLREQELERAYAEASRESDSTWEATVADGLFQEC